MLPSNKYVTSMTEAPSSTLDRSLAVLYHCAEHPEGSHFSALKEVAGFVAASTLSRILSALCKNDDLRKDPETGLYFCGERFLNVARSINGHVDLDAILPAIVKTLAHACNESAAYFHWDGDWMYIRAKHELDENFHYTALGSRNHPIDHTFFRCIQAYLSKRESKHLDNAGSQTILEQIRIDEFYQQTENYRYPVFRITAPVFAGPNIKVIGAIGITSLINNLSIEEINAMTEHVCSAAATATQQLKRMEF